MLVYDDAEKVDGQTIEYGVRGSMDLGNFNIMGWYYAGKLIDDEDWKKRLHYDFDYYATIEPDNVLSENANIDHYWFGVRAEYSIFKLLEANISNLKTVFYQGQDIMCRPVEKLIIKDLKIL